jgi:hypothetical protein
MNEFKAEIGGHKISVNDLNWIANSSKEQLTNIVKALIGNSNENKIILFGCVITKVGNDYTNTAGSFYYNGEIYPVDASLATLTSTTPAKWDIDISYGPQNPVLYKDGSTHNVHHIRKLKLVDGSSATEFLYNDVGIKQLKDIIKADNKANKAIEPWRYVGTTGQPTFENFWSNRYSATNVLKFRKDDLGNVVITGFVYNSFSSNQLQPIFTLPLEYRPNNSDGIQYILCYAENDGGPGNTIVNLSVQANGRVFLVAPIGTTFTKYVIGISIKFNVSQL